MLDMLFVHNYYEQMLGIMQISSVLKQHGFTTDVTVGTKKHILDKVIKLKPKVVGFYCTTGFHHKNIAIAAEIKKIMGKDTLTVFGGPHPTFVPGMIMAEGVDIICRGEGEYAVLELLQSLRTGFDYTVIHNLTIKKDGIVYDNPLRPLCDVNALPHPDRDIYCSIKYIYESKRQEVIIGRGCPYSCSFCSAHAYRELYKGKGMHVRLRSIPAVIDELKQIKNRYHTACFFFHDDIFTVDEIYCENLLAAYRKHIDLPFSCLVRADSVTEGTIKQLKMSGCHLVYFGVESGNEALRTTVLGKHISDEQILQCAALLHKYEIPFVTFNMVGLPEENLVHVWDTIDLNIQLKPVWAWFSTYQTLPQTQLAQYAFEKGYLSAIDVAEADASFHESSEILRIHPEARKIVRLKNCANIVIKFPFLRNTVKNVVLKLPVDPVFEAIDKFMYFVFYYSKLTYKKCLLDTFYSALFLIRHMKEFK